MVAQSSSEQKFGWIVRRKRSVEKILRDRKSSWATPRTDNPHGYASKPRYGLERKSEATRGVRFVVAKEKKSERMQTPQSLTFAFWMKYVDQSLPRTEGQNSYWIGYTNLEANWKQKVTAGTFTNRFTGYVWKMQILKISLIVKRKSRLTIFVVWRQVTAVENGSEENAPLVFNFEEKIVPIINERERSKSISIFLITCLHKTAWGRERASIAYENCPPRRYRHIWYTRPTLLSFLDC